MNANQIENNEPQFISLLEHDDYEILNQYPFTIRRKSDQFVPSESTSNGYVNIHLNNKSYNKHTLIAKQFIPNPNNLPYVDHINHNRSDNHLSNLRWVTFSQNIFNKSSHHGIQYEFIDDLPKEAIKILFYDTRTEHYEFEDEKYYYYHDDENDEDLFYGRIDETTYRILHINENTNGLKLVRMRDVNHKSVALYINRFKHQYTLD